MNAKPSARTLANIGVVVAAVVAMAGTSLLPATSPRAHAAGLTPYDGCAPLLTRYRAELAKKATRYGFGDTFWRRGMENRLGGPAPDAAATAADSALATGGAVGSGPTGTNLQEAGVDEPDTVKLVDGLLYRLDHGGKLHIVRAGAEPALLSTTVVAADSSGELLVAGDRVLVIARTFADAPRRGASMAADTPYRSREHQVTLTLLDVADPTAPRALETYTIDGAYLAARLSDGRVRLVTLAVPHVEPAPLRYPNYPKISDPAAGHAEIRRWEQHLEALDDAALAENRRRAERATLAELLPNYTRRNGAGRVVDKGLALGCSDVRYAKSGSHGASTLVVTTLAPGRGLDPLHSTGVTTDGNVVYASADRLVVATSRWGTTQPADDAPAISDDTVVTTELHTFATGNRDRADYVASGSVPGYVYGRWAISYHEGHLRVATTSAAPWGAEERSVSTLSVLAERAGSLVRTGSVTGLGKGERIQAVRYFGDLATVVTFRQIDPLYVLDLADPTAPAVRGELKIPGFSSYLHPVGDHHLLGLGFDADRLGRTTGMQVSLFDLTDLSRPTQVSRLALGAGHSAALLDSRAFTYDPARRLALLPMTVWTPDPRHEALGVRVTDDWKLVTAGALGGDPHSDVERVLVHDDHVFAVGIRDVVAGTADDLRRTGRLELTQ